MNRGASSEVYDDPDEITVYLLHDMTEIDIPVEREETPETFARRLEQAVDASGLVIACLGTLGKYPGSIHWHIRTNGKTGTLEVTFWPAQGRAWFSIRERRRAEWIPDGVRAIAEHMRTPL